MIPRIAILLVAVSILSVGAAQATLIDSFNAEEQFLHTRTSNPIVWNQVEPGSTVAIGKFRDVMLQLTSGRSDYSEVMTDFGGVFTFTQGTAEGLARITWDGEDSENTLRFSLNQDLQSPTEDGFLIDIAEVTGTGVILQLDVYTNDADHVSSYTTLVSAGTSGTLLAPYASFIPSGGSGSANFDDVDAIVLTFDGTGHAGSDITIGSIETGKVPEPTVWTILATGMASLMFTGWRRRNLSR